MGEIRVGTSGYSYFGVNGCPLPFNGTADRTLPPWRLTPVSTAGIKPDLRSDV